MGRIDDQNIYELGSIILEVLDYLGNKFKEAARIFQSGPYICYDRFPHTGLLFYLPHLHLHLTFISPSPIFKYPSEALHHLVSNLADRFSSSCLHIPLKLQQNR